MGFFQSGQDVFNALEVMDNPSFFEDLKFSGGDGLLHFYVFNWKCPQMECSQMGLVLV